ncbi:MAG: PAS domain-containing protein [Alphaproteobacteria bacterium]
MNLGDVTKALPAFMRDAVIIAEAEPVGHPGPRVVWCNDAFTEMTGYAREDIIGQTPRILQGEGTDPATLSMIRRGLADWQHVRAEVLNYRKSGEPFWVELDIKPVPDETGWYHYWVAVQRDITERKAREAELERALAVVQREKANLEREKSRLWLQGLVAQHTNEIVIVTDCLGRIEWANAAFSTHTEYDLDEVVGRTPGSVLQGARTDRETVERLRRSLRDGCGGTFDLVNYTKSGRPYWINMTITQYTEPTGS